MRIGAGGKTIATNPVSTTYTRPETNLQSGNAEIARSGSNADGRRSVRIGDRFCLEFPCLALKMVHQHGEVCGKTSDAAVGPLKHDDVKLPVRGNCSGKLIDFASRPNCSNNPGVDSTADVTHYNGPIL